MNNYITTTSGTSYRPDTKQNIIDICEQAIYRRQRVKIKYKDGFEDFTGYTRDGLNVTMYIGRSTGNIKIPLHIPSRRSTGGAELSTNLIEAIKLI